jgi:hypothetical protein
MVHSLIKYNLYSKQHLSILYIGIGSEKKIMWIFVLILEAFYCQERKKNILL